MQQIQHILTAHNTHAHTNYGVTICVVPTMQEGITLTKEILYQLVNKRTVWYLSGGSQKTLYEYIAKEEVIIPGAVGLVDERYGEPFHDMSNEKTIRDTGLLRYLHMRDIPFYPIIQKDKTREEVAREYDERVRSLHAIYQQSVGLIGMGPDGHISSVIPNRHNFHNPWFDSSYKHLLVSEFNDTKSSYKERVGMTFLGLSMLDVLIVPAFGDSKKDALENIFTDGREEDLPARFFKRPEIAKKTVIVTDQMI